MDNFNLSEILIKDNQKNINLLLNSYQRLEGSNKKPSFLKLLTINDSIEIVHNQFLEKLKIFDKENEFYINFHFKFITFNCNNKFYYYNFFNNTIDYNIDETIKNKIVRFIKTDECQNIMHTYIELNKISKNYKSLKNKLFKERQKDLLFDFNFLKEFLIKKNELNSLNNIEENKKYISIVLKIDYFNSNFILEQKNRIIKNNRKERFVFYFEKNKNYTIEDYIRNSDFKFLYIEYYNLKFYLDRKINLENLRIIDNIINF